MSCLVATSAVAATPAEVAVEAARVMDELCSDAAGTDTTLAAGTVNTVSAMWLQVSEAYEERAEPFLLYWRGVLEQCLDQEERARADLERFLFESGQDSTYADLSRDARRRLRRLLAAERTGPGVGPPVAAGIAAAGGAGLFAALAAWQGDLAVSEEERYYSGELTTPEFPFVEIDMVEAARRRNAFAAGGGALAVVSVASFVVVVTRADRAPRDLRGLPVISVVPMPDGGIVLGLAGRW